MQEKDIISIENEDLAVKARRTGGALTSVVDKGRGEELLYQPRKDAWDDQDIIIFPFVARLKDKYYELDGKRYDMEIHGVARKSEFAVESAGNASATLLLTGNADTMKRYPFPFELRVSYRLDGKKLVTALSVTNTGDADMPFMLGGHPGYRLDCRENADGTDTCGNYIVWEKRDYKYLTLDPTGCFITGETDFGPSEGFETSKAFFVKYNTLMLRNFEGPLLLKKRTRTLRFELGKVPVLAFWSNPQYGDYICIEPWFGRPDDETPVRDFRQKPLMNTLAPRKTFRYTYSMEVL